MHLQEHYSKKSDEELVHLIEEQGLTTEAVRTVSKILSDRECAAETIQQFATNYYIAFFKDEFSKTILTTLGESEMPQSVFLSEDELKQAAENAFEDVMHTRSDFYRDLPFG